MVQVKLEYVLGLGVVSELVGLVGCGLGLVHFHWRSSWWAGTFQEPFFSLGFSWCRSSTLWWHRECWSLRNHASGLNVLPVIFNWNSERSNDSMRYLHVKSVLYLASSQSLEELHKKVAKPNPFLNFFLFLWIALPCYCCISFSLLLLAVALSTSPWPGWISRKCHIVRVRVSPSI